MSSLTSVKAAIQALTAGIKHLFRKRMTLFYPDVKLDLQEGWRFDVKERVGIPGLRGRHLLYMDRCTGCTQCFFMCQRIAGAIKMVEVEGEFPRNKRRRFPQVDYALCVFCGFCVDACPFNALTMTPDYELAGEDKEALLYPPQLLAEPSKVEGKRVHLRFGRFGSYHK